MSETRRVQLTTLSFPAGQCFPTSPAAAPVLQRVPPGPPAEQCGPDMGTVRLVLDLFEPDEWAFPEFSYSQLLDREKSVKVPLSRMEHQEQREKEELAQIAKKLEEKYGGMLRPQDRIQDLIDIGYGYDDEDSFIDNSEAYDEFVPASLTTNLGGFYVNSGLLQFRQVSDTEPDGEEPSAKRMEASKRKLKGGPDKPMKKRCDDDSEGDAKTGLKKKKKKPTALSMTSALRRCERQRQEQAGASARGPPLGFSTLALGPADAGGGGCMSFTDPPLRLTEPPKELTLDSDLDCVLVSEDSSSTHSLPPTSAPPPNSDGAMQTQGTDEEMVSQTCPESFPVALEDSIHKLQMASKTSEEESKVKFYTPEINELLLLIDEQCRQHGGPHGGSLRSRVYSHLCSFLPCNKSTLLRRDVEQLMKSLKKAIEKTMPAQILSWKEMCGAPQHTAMATEEEEMGGKKVHGPKKLFKWNDEIREALRRLLKMKLEQFQKDDRAQEEVHRAQEEVHRAQEMVHRAQEEVHRAQEEVHRAQEEVDQYLSSVLEEEVKPLWPKGWMSSRILHKEARKLLSPELMLVKMSRQDKLSQTTTTPASCDSAVVIPGQRGVATNTYPASSDNRPTASSKPAPTASRSTHLLPPFQQQELLVAAVARYKQCTQRWCLSEVAGSPPLPPPPPQSSPINFPLTPLSALIPNLDPTKNM